MNIKKKNLTAQFLYSVPKLAQMREHAPEVVFVGRSNSGKSTLINALCKKNNLAKSSKTPGRTRSAVVFLINLSSKNYYFVDMPGYGYANMSKSEAEGCEELIFSYLKERERIDLILLMLDIRREPDERELAIINIAKSRGSNIAVVFTKSDKYVLSRREPRRKNLSQDLNLFLDQVILHSSDLPESTENLLKFINNALIQPRPS